MQLDIFKHLKALDTGHRKIVHGPMSVISEDFSEATYDGTATVYRIDVKFGSISAVTEGDGHGDRLRQAVERTREGLTRSVFGPIEDEVVMLGVALQGDDRDEAMRRAQRVLDLIRGREIPDA